MPLKNKFYLLLRTLYIVVVAAVIVFLVVYFLKKSVTTASAAVEEVIPERVYSKTDSMIFRFDTLVTERLKRAGTVGAAWAITHNGEIALLNCYGVQKKGGQTAINENTAFRLASVSKTITGALAGILSSEGEILLDDKVIDYLPGFKLMDSINTVDLTIRNILSHTSGLVPHAYDNLVEAQLPMEVIIDSLRLVNISDVPGKLYGYQNVVFSMYDTIAEVQTMQSFPELLREKVFIPFGMDEASADFESFSSSQNIAYPHSQGRVLRLNNRYYNTKPAAGINASISDMANFLLGINDRDAANKEAFDEILTPQVLSPLRRVYLRQWKGVESKHYGLGWRIIGYHGREIAYHGGYVQGYRAEIALCRDKDIGIVYLTNSPGNVGSWVVPTFLDMYFGNIEP